MFASNKEISSFFISHLTKPHPSSQREPCQPKCSPFIASFRTKLKPSLCACTFGPSCRDSPPLQVRAGLPACRAFSFLSESRPKGTGNNAELTSLFTCVISHKWPTGGAAGKLRAQWSLGAHGKDSVRLLCFLIKLQIKAW